ASLLKQMIPQITKHNHHCILLVVTNPLDALTYLTLKYSHFPPNKVFGTGTILDTARLRYKLGHYFGVSPDSVHAYVMGEHGDAAFPVWSAANIAGTKLRYFEKYSKEAMNRIFAETRNAAYEIVARKGATYYAIGLAVAKIVRAVVSDQNEVLALSCYLKNYHGISDVCLSVPAIVNRDGIKQQIAIQLNALEKRQLRKAAAVIKNVVSQCKS
ncbi:MAG: L-lactate dehydrogenase, partial [Acidobacteria bacterium]|nr:L-lactate dehydrogenase [Acidobacteriota bacterium]